MERIRLALLFLMVVISANGKPKPTTESTHALLKRLGFDPVQKTSQFSHHSKRVALETNKARYHNNDFYGSSSDSRMFVVKLPPHSPYYSHVKPEKFKNEASSTLSKPTNFRTNGKPGQIYHWNIPVLRKLNQEKRGTSLRNLNEDSKVYHIKILPNGHLQSKNSIVRGDSHKKNNKQKNKQQIDATKLNKYYRNKLYRLNDSQNGTSSGPENSTRSTINSLSTGLEKRGNSNYYGPNKKVNDKYTNEVSKIKGKTNRSPNYYVPAIPQQNSFHKYFTGNGKLKSFYVIEKSKKQTRLHRLL